MSPLYNVTIVIQVYHFKEIHIYGLQDAKSSCTMINQHLNKLQNCQPRDISPSFIGVSGKWRIKIASMFCRSAATNSVISCRSALPQLQPPSKGLCNKNQQFEAHKRLLFMNDTWKCQNQKNKSFQEDSASNWIYDDLWLQIEHLKPYFFILEVQQRTWTDGEWVGCLQVTGLTAQLFAECLGKPGEWWKRLNGLGVGWNDFERRNKLFEDISDGDDFLFITCGSWLLVLRSKFNTFRGFPRYTSIHTRFGKLPSASRVCLL